MSSVSRIGPQADRRTLDREFALLDAASRQRKLELHESLRLEKIIKEIDGRDGRRKRERRG
jgi:hypothetical protein